MASDDLERRRDRRRRFLARTMGPRLPRVDGTVEVDGIEAPVSIARNDHGIPTIVGASHRDVTFGLGYAVGQDRAFQLEFLRRAAGGTLSELVGRRGLAIDRLARVIGFRRAAERQWERTGAEHRHLLQAYADGVSAALVDGPRPHELALLRAAPGRWSPVDVLAFVKVMASALSTNWETELDRMAVLASDGFDALADCDPDGTPVIGRLDLHPTVASVVDLLASDLRLPLVGASNNWALAPSRTRDRHPLVASDPHLNPTAPSYWYLAQMRTPRWSCGGAVLVGAPGVIIGQNDHLAWSVTAGRADQSDLAVEELDASGTRCRRGDGWVDLEVRDERISVRGRRDVVERVRSTDRGPIVTSEASIAALSLSAAWLGDAPLSGFFDLAEARGGAQLRRAFEGWIGPPVNICFAESSGRIGWCWAADVAKRTEWSPLPTCGADAVATEPRRSGDDLPWVEDPSSGVVATANDLPGGRPDPTLGDDWADPFRVERLRRVLAGADDWTIERCQRLHLDVTFEPWSRLRPHLEHVEGSTPLEEHARLLLVEWSGVVSADDPAALVAEAWMHHLAEALYRLRAPRSADVLLGRSMHPFAGLPGFTSRRISFLVRTLEERPPAFAPASAWDPILLGALSLAVDDLRRWGGPDPQRWTLGRLRPVVYRHALSALPLVGRLLDLGPCEVGGNLNTIAMAASDPVHPRGGVVAAPTLRAVLDATDPSASRYSLPGGQSGNPVSSHYDDLLGRFLVGAGVTLAAGPSGPISQLDLLPR